MRALHMAMAAGVALASPGCAKLDTLIQQNLPQACADVTKAHNDFVAISNTGVVSAKAIEKEAIAYDGVKQICADPEHTTALDAIVKVTAAYAEIKTALKAAAASN